MEQIKFIEEKKRVANEIANMLINNIVENNGIESFAGWCENGFIFENERGKISPLVASNIMYEVAPYIDKISNILKTR